MAEIVEQKVSDDPGHKRIKLKGFRRRLVDMHLLRNKKVDGPTAKVCLTV